MSLYWLTVQGGQPVIDLGPGASLNSLLTHAHCLSEPLLWISCVDLAWKARTGILTITNLQGFRSANLVLEADDSLTFSHLRDAASNLRYW